MTIVGKKSFAEIQTMRAEIIERDKKDHNWFANFTFVMLLPCSAAWGGVLYLVLATISAAVKNTEVEWVFADHWPYMLATVAVTFIALWLWLHKPYKFDDNSMSLPKTYRYFHLTNGKSVIREDVYFDGSRADLTIVTRGGNGDEEYAYVGEFPVVIKRDIEETIIDLDAEKMYVPYNANDVEFAEDCD